MLCQPELFTKFAQFLSYDGYCTHEPQAYQILGLSVSLLKVSWFYAVCFSGCYSVSHQITNLLAELKYCQSSVIMLSGCITRWVV